MYQTLIQLFLVPQIERNPELERKNPAVQLSRLQTL